MLTRLGRARRRDEAGAIAILFSLVALVLFGIAGLVVDLGVLRDSQQQAQNTADASALAAGNALYPDAALLTINYPAAIDAAKTYASANAEVTEADWAACTDPGHLTVIPGYTECISFQSDADYSKVRVSLPTTSVSFGFARAIGFSSATVNAISRSVIDTGGRVRCGLCVLGSTAHDVQNGDVTVDGGDIHFNGSVNVGPQGLVATSGAITVQGYASGGNARYDPDPLVNQPAIPDPLAGMALPPDLTGLQVKTNPCTDGPGKYGSISFNNTTCTLQSGLYVVAGGTWNLSGSGSTNITAPGVTVYFTCGTPAAPSVCQNQVGGSLDLTGNGKFTITAPTSGPLARLAVVYDRTNTADFRMAGNGDTTTTGTIYAPASKLLINGNGQTNSIHSLIVVGNLELNGNNSALVSHYAQGENIQRPAANLHLDQ